jgi:medium-chain acyl-[acyl-carrier-protein] hydrolase
MRLFCFPYAGGGITPFQTWSSGLPPGVDLCPVQLPGRENRLSEPPFRSLPPLVQELRDVLQPYMDIPFAFFGYSMGGLIGFELARQLRQAGRPGPVRLFVAAVLPPEQIVTVPPIHHLSDDAFLKALSARYEGLQQAVLENAELMALCLPVLRADLTVLDTYAYTPDDPLDCPISAFGGLRDRVITRQDVEAWRGHTRGAFTIRMFPGGHFFLHDDRLLLLQAISQDLRKAGFDRHIDEQPP